MSRRKLSPTALPTLVPTSLYLVSAISWPPGTIHSSTLPISPEEKPSSELPEVWRSRPTEKSHLLTQVKRDVSITRCLMTCCSRENAIFLFPPRFTKLQIKFSEFFSHASRYWCRQQMQRAQDQRSSHQA